MIGRNGATEHTPYPSDVAADTIYQNAGHELTYQARVDRLAWIREQFTLSR